MNVRFKFKTLEAALEVASKLPIRCMNRIVRDRTTDVYLEVPEDYENYVKRYLIDK